MKNNTSIDILNYIKIFNVNNLYSCCVCRKKFKIKVIILSKMNMCQERLNEFILLLIEKELLNGIDYNNLMKDFAFKKV